MHKNVAVLEALRNIPKGKVTTYSELAKACKTSPRAVGMIMKHNPQPDCYPCYKVVRSDGALGGYSGPGGVKKKIMLLEKDGIEVRNNKINLEKYLYTFRKTR